MTATKPRNGRITTEKVHKRMPIGHLRCNILREAVFLYQTQITLLIRYMFNSYH